jgi:hypothetical protein
LHSWTPRHPSAKLKARLFAKPADAAAPPQPWSLGWLAPATVCLLLLFVTLNQRSGELGELTSSSSQFPMMAVTLSNTSFAAYLPASLANDRNAVRPQTFEWTNHGRSTSTTASFPQSRTNYLKR